jgi:hypothetical protein
MHTGAILEDELTKDDSLWLTYWVSFHSDDLPSLDQLDKVLVCSRVSCPSPKPVDGSIERSDRELFHIEAR